MERHELEHLIRAASEIAGVREWIVVGSQSILGAVPDAPEALKMSLEADIYSRLSPKAAELIDAVIGEESNFYRTHGYYAQGVDATTAKLPLGWEGRLTLVKNENTNGAKAYCIDPHDMALSKLYADREKDRDFVRDMFRHGIIDVERIVSRSGLLQVDEGRRALIATKAKRLWRESDVSQDQDDELDTSAAKERDK